MKSGWMALALICAAGSAGAWDKSDDKGLKLYRAAGQGIEAIVVCDPERLWQPPENHLTFKIAGQEKTGEYTVSAGGKKARAHLEFGTAIHPELGAMLAVLRAGSVVDVTLGRKTYRIDTGQPFSGDCGEK